MSRVILRGMSGANPLGFMGTLGLVRVLSQLSQQSNTIRVGFLADGTFSPFFEGFDGNIAAAVAEDAALSAEDRSWWLEYEKQEKKGTKIVADLKAPPEEFAKYLTNCIHLWCQGKDDAAAYAASFGTDVAVDGKKNTKPTAFHFTAANQQFLGTVETIRASVSADWAACSLFEGHAARPGSNLRWDPAAERNWALMANNPIDEGTSVDAPLEWLAFRGLPLFPSFPRGTRIITTAVSGRGDEMKMTWPLWSVPVTLHTLRSLLQMRFSEAANEREERAMRGIFAVCSSSIRRTSQGFGNFGPAAVTS